MNRDTLKLKENDMAIASKLSDREREAVNGFVGAIKALFGPRLVSVKLFGSKATGVSEQYSDIDVCVIVREACIEDEDKVLDIAFDINVALGVYLSPRVIDYLVLHDPVWKITPFLQTIEKEGIAL
jgi:predicted nucleotidyltransferase